MNKTDPINAPDFALSRKGAVIDLNGEPLYQGVSTFGQQIDVHRHPELGHLMFIDGEVQISDVDFVPYHSAMLSFIPKGASILVIGDGDGGFTNQPDYNITQVEPDPVVMVAAENYFGANWTDRDGFRLIHKTLHDYVQMDDPTEYDAVFLAITDEFNSDAKNFEDVAAVWSKLKLGGKLVAQVGCTDDPCFDNYAVNYDYLWQKLDAVREDKKVYIQCFHSDHLFSAFTKDH